MRILFFGDVVGRPGRKILAVKLREIKSEYSAELVIVNGENASGGFGIEPKTADEIFGAGADLITTGNHIWDKKDIIGYLKKNSSKIIRPANFPHGAPGTGTMVHKLADGRTVGVANLMGRIFLSDILDCPFQAAERILSEDLSDADIKIFDFHAEATSEKLAIAHMVDGRATMVVGTHTHVQTADEWLMPKGTAYISDVGMCGPRQGILGMDATKMIERFCTGLPARYDIAKGPVQINAVMLEVCDKTSKALKIERINRVYEAI